MFQPIDEVHELVVTEGAKKFLEEAQKNLPAHVRKEVQKLLPLLKVLQTPKTSYGPKFSNANLALELRQFFEARKRLMSEEAFNAFDSWSIAIDGMIRQNRRSNTYRNAHVDAVVASTPKYPNRCVHVT